MSNGVILFGFDWSEGFAVMPRSLHNPDHPYHPRNDKGAKTRGVSLMSALDELIHIARWKDGQGLRAGQRHASVRFLAQRWNTPRSTVHQILKRFEADGYIRRIPQPGYRQADVIEIVGYAEFVARRRAAYLQLVSDAGTPVTTRRFPRVPDAIQRRRPDKEDLFATGEAEVGLVGKVCESCGVEIDEWEPADVCVRCAVEHQVLHEVDEGSTALNFRVIHRIDLDPDAVLFGVARLREAVST